MALSAENLFNLPEPLRGKKLRAQFAAREPRLPAIFHKVVAIASEAVSSEPALLKKRIAADPALKQLAFGLFVHCHLILLAVSRFGYIKYRRLAPPAALIAHLPPSLCRAPCFSQRFVCQTHQGLTLTQAQPPGKAVIIL